jgi:hypothetical protein
MKTLMTYIANSLEIMCGWQHMLPIDDFLQRVWILMFDTHCPLMQLALMIDAKYEVWEYKPCKDRWPDYPVPEEYHNWSDKTK